MIAEPSFCGKRAMLVLVAFSGTGFTASAAKYWPCHWHAKIAQGPRFTEIEPELYLLAVSGQFHDLIKRRKKRLRGRRAGSSGAPSRAQPVGHARRARRRFAGLARGLEVGRAVTFFPLQTLLYSAPVFCWRDPRRADLEESTVLAQL